MGVSHLTHPLPPTPHFQKFQNFLLKDPCQWLYQKVKKSWNKRRKRMVFLALLARVTYLLSILYILWMDHNYLSFHGDWRVGWNVLDYHWILFRHRHNHRTHWRRIRKLKAENNGKLKSLETNSSKWILHHLVGSCWSLWIGRNGSVMPIKPKFR